MAHDHSGMDMDSGMDTMYPENPIYAREFWYIVAAATGSFAAIRIGRFLHSKSSLRRIRLEPGAIPSRPTTLFSKSIATTTAILRESTYWQPWTLNGRISQFFTPPSAGKCILLALYLVVILTMLFQNTLMSPDDPMYVYKFEKMGYRAAWINITQIPFIYLLSTKLNIISFISGVSYERLNWLHRWASRVVFITVIFHWAYFFTEWYEADLVAIQLEMMPSITYGFIAWAILGWQVLTSLGLFRNMAYELWVIQHIASAAVLLWALYMHVPAKARYNIWMAIAFVAFDRIGRAVFNVIQNVGILRRGPNGMSLGYTATLEALPDGYTKVCIPNIHFTWKAGQHIYLTIPRLGPVEAHPFTIANDQDYDQQFGSRTINLLIKAQSGFSKRIHTAARTSPSKTYKAFVSGPWGQPPNLSSYETIIFIANSTGATYNLPLFQQIAKSRTCAKNVVFSWICKESCQISWFQNQILAASDEIMANGAKVSVSIGCTGGADRICCCCAPPPTVLEKTISPIDEDSIEEINESSCCLTPVQDSKNEKSFQEIAKVPFPSTTTTILEKPLSSASTSSSTPSISLEDPSCTCICALRLSASTKFSTSRPTLESIILPAIEAARGETAIVVCGRKSLLGDVRNYVAALSDERAVHKGSGAQGVFLFGEEFGW